MNIEDTKKASLSMCNDGDKINHLTKLEKYKLIKTINNVRIGTYIRWIRIDEPSSLKIGGIINNVIMNSSGNFVDIYNKYTKSNIRVKIDDYVVLYQKMTDIELLINDIQDKFYKNDLEES